MVDGGYDWNHRQEIATINKHQLRDILIGIKEVGIKNIVVAGICSTLNSSHEALVSVHGFFEENFKSQCLIFVAQHMHVTSPVSLIALIIPL